MTEKKPTHTDVRSYVRERYAGIAERSKSETRSCGCASTESSCCGSESEAQLDTVAKLYQDPNVADLPAEVTGLSLGCGDPVTLASLEVGQTVLDLGSGGGIDCFLAAKKVGPAGKVIGVDMTPAMIDRARHNQRKIGAENVEFRLGEIEHLPVEDASVDVIISNCVINLSPDKPQVFREAFRALRPGGLLAVSDIVTDGELPAAVKNSMSAWAGCVAGALDVNEYIAAIQDAGFTDVQVDASYWDAEIVDAAVEQLDPELKARLKAAQGSGRAVLVVGEGSEGELIEIEPGELGAAFDPRKTVFSARVTARKP
ncbi:MAG: arsenite methyltransferase [Anaerolineales bacterium]|jgi:SAM-dependent methyltransferase